MGQSLCQQSHSSKRAFSLLEVVVAMTILGLFLVSILSAQGGLSASNKKAQNMGLAIHYGRCKMSELEEKTLKFGYPEIDDLSTGDPCCEGDSAFFRCDTRIEKIMLPAMGGGSDAGAALNLGASAGLFGDAGTAAGLGSLGGGGLNLDGGLSSVASSLNAQTGGQGAAGLLNMVMGFVYPMFKPLFEASIRRLTVKVRWKDGSLDRDLTLVQYITNPQRVGFVAGALGQDGGIPSAGAAVGAGVGVGGTGSGGASTTPTPTPPFGGR